MKRTLSKNLTYIGAGIGLTMFALFGLYGSFLGGAVGLKITGAIFGMPLGAAVLPRVMVGAFMVLGVIVSGFVFITSASMIGWLIGHAVDSVYNRAAESPANTK